MDALGRHPAPDQEARESASLDKRPNEPKTIREIQQVLKETEEYCKRNKMQKKDYLVMIGLSRSGYHKYLKAFNEGFEYGFDFEKFGDQKIGTIKTFADNEKKKQKQ